MSLDLPIEIVPSYPAPSWEALEQVLQKLSRAVPEFQVDIVGEDFAGTKSWPETEADSVSAISRLAAWQDQFDFELDLMVSDPAHYFAACKEIKVSRVVVHVRNETDIDTILERAKEQSLEVSLALTAEVSLDKVVPYIAGGEVMAVQLMGIEQVGRQGQPFDTRVLSRIRSLRQQFPDLSIAVDGAVNAETLPQLYAAGANRFAPGSAIVKSEDPVAVYKQLQNILS